MPEYSDPIEIYDSLLFLVDIQNLFYTARDSFGLASRIDFRKLRDIAVGGRKFRHIYMYAYTASMPQNIPNELITALKKLAYEVRIANIRQHEQGKASLTNIDTMLVHDALETKIAGKYPDIVVIASGDSGYIPTYRSLRERGCRVEIIAFPMSLGAAVYDAADKVTTLEREHLYSFESAS